MKRFLVFLIAGWSGFYVMAIEMLGGRLLAPHFGSGIYVWGAVITIFMLALSLGYLLGGYLSMFGPTLARLAQILLAAALAGVPLVVAGESTLDLVFDLIQDPRYGSLLAATLLFFVPTLISGMVSPYAVRLLVREQRLSGRVAGYLYFVSTLGSAAGTIVTSFYLVLYFDVDRIVWGLIAVSVAIGVLALLQGRGDEGAT